MNRNEDRTLSGSTEIVCDILDLPSTINAIRVKNVFGQGGQVLAKNPTTNKLEWSVVPIADDTITTNMIVDGAITNDKLATNSVSNAKIINATIDGTKLASNININTTGALTVGGITTLKNIVLFYDGDVAKASYIPAIDTLIIGNITISNYLSVGSGGILVVSEASNTITLGGDTLIGGELEMSVGGAEVFNMNSHNLTNGGDATFNSLTLGTALNMLNLNLDLGSGDLTANNIDCADISADTLSIDGGTTLINDTGITLKDTGGGASTILLNHATGLVSCLGLNTNNNIIQTGGGGVETSGGYLDTAGGNLSMLNGDIIGANDIECVNLDAGTIEGTTNLNGVMNVGYGAIDSITNNGQITGYVGSFLHIRLDNGAIGCSSLNTNGGAINTYGGDLSCGIINSNAVHNQIFGSSLHLSSTSIGLTPTTSVVYPTTIPIKQFDIYSALNDIPRIIATKSFYADYLYTRSLNTTYKNIDKDTTTLNVAFDVPPSCKILVEVGAMARSNVVGQRLLCKLVNSAGTEFYTEYINDTDHGTSTNDTLIRYRQYADSTIYLGVVKFFLSFPTSEMGVSVNLQPQFRVSSGTSALYTGVDVSAKYPAMYVKVESLGSTSAYNWHMETSTGGDDY